MASSDITKSKLPLVTAGTLLLFVAGGAVAWADAKNETAQTKDRVQRAEERLTANEREVQELKTQTALIRQAMQNLVETTQEIRQDVKDLKRR